MSTDVPPMSSVRIFSSPISRPVKAAPITPEAGPESNVSTGRAPAASSPMTPPLDLVEKIRVRTPKAEVFFCSVSKYRRIRAPT